MSTAVLARIRVLNFVLVPIQLFKNVLYPRGRVLVYSKIGAYVRTLGPTCPRVLAKQCQKHYTNHKRRAHNIYEGKGLALGS